MFEGTLGEFAGHSLQLAVWDKDRITKDDHLGTLEVSLDALRGRERVEFTQPLPTQGSLTFYATWQPVQAQLLAKGTLTVHLEHSMASHRIAWHSTA